MLSIMEKLPKSRVDGALGWCDKKGSLWRVDNCESHIWINMDVTLQTVESVYNPLIPPHHCTPQLVGNQQGRSSGFRFNLLSAPSRPIFSGQWLWQISSPITAAGPLPICTGFPIKPLWHLT